jgi:hypothetical protein
VTTYFLGDGTVVGETTGLVDEVKACQVGDWRVATAIRNGSKHLEVIVWDVPETGNVSTRHTGQLPSTADYKVGHISIAPLASELGSGTQRALVTAVQHVPGNGLHVLVWKVDASGALTLMGDKRPDKVVEVSEIEVIGTGIGEFVTASIDRTSGEMLLDAWRLDPFTSKISNYAHHTGEKASSPSLAVVGDFVVIARVNTQGLVELVTKTISGGGFVQHGYDSTNAKFSEVAVSSIDPGRDGHDTGVVTASRRDPGGEVQLTTWHVDQASGAITALHRAIGKVGRTISLTRLWYDFGSASNEHVLSLSVGDTGDMSCFMADIDAGGGLTPRLDAALDNGSKLGALGVAYLPPTTRVGDFGATEWLDHVGAAYEDKSDNHRMRSSG